MRLSFVTILVSAALAGCGTDQTSVSQSVGENCTPDQMLWTFSTTGESATSAAAQAEPDASVPVLQRNVFTSFDTVECRFVPKGPDGRIIIFADGGYDHTETQQNTIRWTENCRDLTRCTLTTGCVSDELARANPKLRPALSNGSVYASYTCSVTGQHADIVPGYLVANTVGFACPQPTAPQPTRAARTACVPRVCNGNTRRDENMNCVADNTRQLIHQRDLRVLPMSLTPDFVPFQTDENGTVAKVSGRHVSGARLDRRLDPGQAYTFRGGLQYIGVPPPPNARLALWLSEVHDDAAPQRAASESFRCLVRTFDVGVLPVDGGTPPGVGHTVTFNERIELPPDCFNEAIAYDQELPQFSPSERKGFGRAKVASLRFHVSFDLENATNFIPEGKTQLDACGTDPLQLFYYPSSQLYDYRSYYRQRELVPYDRALDYSRTPPVSRTSYEGYFFGRDDFLYAGNRFEVGLSDVRSSRPEVTIRVNSAATQSISVAGDWYLALDSGGLRKHLRQTFDPTFRVYLVPRTDGGVADPQGAEGYPTIGAAPMQPIATPDGRPTVGPLGVTVNSRFIVDAPLKQRFLTPGSLAYVENGTKTFEVLGCLELTAGDYAFVPEFWKDDRYYELFQGIELGSDSAAEKAYRPPGAPNPGRGCRWSKVPLVVTIDRSVGAVEPIADELWQGQANTQQSGNGSVNQANDNDVDRTCQTLDGGAERCEQGSGAGQAGKGDYGKSYYSTSTSSMYTPGSLRMTPSGPQDDSDSAGGAEILGYQVLDPEEEEPTKQWQLDGPAQVQKATLTITPPWDAIWAAIKEANEGTTNPEWVRGRYAGLMGLGVGWGYKQPVGNFGTVTFTVSVGFSLALVTSVSHSTDPDGNYKCIRDALPDGGAPEPCIQPGADSETFSDANTDCATRGGRLAELSSLSEGAALQAFMVSSSSPGEPVWIGAQQLDEYNPPACLFGWVEGRCRAGHKTSFRWVSNDRTFARSTGSSAGVIDGSQIATTGASPNLIPRAPAKAGILLSTTGNVSSETLSNKHPYVCLYDAAKKDTPIVVSAAIEAGFAAGVGVEWCWPAEGKFAGADKFGLGICLAGTLNLVSLKIAPTVETTFHHLVDHRGRHARRDNVNLFAEWGLTLLEGEVALKIKALWFEFSMVLLQFSGFKIDGGKLYDFNFPTAEPFR